MNIEAEQLGVLFPDSRDSHDMPQNPTNAPMFRAAYKSKDLEFRLRGSGGSARNGFKIAGFRAQWRFGGSRCSGALKQLQDLGLLGFRVSEG